MKTPLTSCTAVGDPGSRDRVSSHFHGLADSSSVRYGNLESKAGADPEIEEGGGVHVKWGLVRRAC